MKSVYTSPVLLQMWTKTYIYPSDSLLSLSLLIHTRTVYITEVLYSDNNNNNKSNLHNAQFDTNGILTAINT